MKVLLECVEGTQIGQTFPFNKDCIALGRSSRCDIVIDPDRAPSVSGRHCIIEVKNNHAVLYDGGSTNGTWLKDKRLEERVILTDGDMFRLGRHGPLFRVTLELASPATSAEKSASGSATFQSQPSQRGRIWQIIFWVALILLFGSLGVLVWLFSDGPS